MIGSYFFWLKLDLLKFTLKGKVLKPYYQMFLILKTFMMESVNIMKISLTLMSSKSCPL
ncbi:hypothetical protein BN1200_540030 [Klebsiella variicola]|nr:hypothetical protein BN1200_540030 [Klebsiella variicola]